MRPLIQIYSHFDESGIQTQMLFIANEQVKQGGVAVIYGERGGLERHLDERVNFVDAERYDRYEDEICNLVEFFSLQDPIIWSSHPFEFGKLVTVAQRLRSRGIDSSIVCGVYHPRACFKPEDSWLTELICKISFWASDCREAYFMSAAVKESHAVRWSRDLGEFPVLPLVMKKKKNECGKNTSCENGIKIISLGRLVPWKSYNLQITSICRELQEKSIKYSWSVFGGGPLLQSLKLEATELGLQSQLIFHGAIDFGNLEKSLLGGDVFVGMGTSLLEAALIGMPSIVAVDSDPEYSYGFLCDLPPGNVGEMLGNPPTFRIIDLILMVQSMSAHERSDLGLRCKEAAEAQTISPKEAVLYFQTLTNFGRFMFRKRVLVFTYKSFTFLRSSKKILFKLFTGNK